MRLIFTPVVPVTLRCRRGANLYRKMDFDPKDGIAIDYPALPESDLEILIDGRVHKTVVVGNNPGRTERVRLDVQIVRANGATPSSGPPAQNNDNVQPVGGEGSPNGGTVPGSVPVQVPPVDKGNAR